MMWSLTHFDDILNKVKGLQEPTVHDMTPLINMTPLNND